MPALSGGRLFRAERGWMLLLGGREGVGCCSRSVSRVWTGPWGLSVIPSLRVAAWSAATDTVGRGQSEGTTSPGVGVMTSTTRVRPREGRSCAGPMQAADVPVAHPGEDQFDELSGGGDLADVGSAALSDLVADLPEPGVLAEALDSLDGGPADQCAALFGDPPAVNLGIGLVVFGSQPGPAA